MLRLGFDIGGTNIAAGLVNDSYQIMHQDSRPFPRGQNAAAVADCVLSLTEALCLRAKVSARALAGVGVAIPGSLDPSGETVLNAYNLDFHNVPFRQMVQDRMPQLRVTLCNDANAATLAEHRAGSLRGCMTAALLTLGTGVGGGLILGGRLFNGGRNSGVEPGHIPLRIRGRVCSCGNSGCLECYCSATRLAVDGGPLGFDDAKQVIDAAKLGDPKAADLFDAYVDDLGSALIAMIHLLDPERIAIGGGVCHAGEFLLQPLRINVAKKCFFESSPEIVRATMGNNAGIVGAACMNEDLPIRAGYPQ